MCNNYSKRDCNYMKRLKHSKSVHGIMLDVTKMSNWWLKFGQTKLEKRPQKKPSWYFWCYPIYHKTRYHISIDIKGLESKSKWHSYTEEITLILSMMSSNVASRQILIITTAKHSENMLWFECNVFIFKSQNMNLKLHPLRSLHDTILLLAFTTLAAIIRRRTTKNRTIHSSQKK